MLKLPPGHLVNNILGDVVETIFFIVVLPSHLLNIIECMPPAIDGMLHGYVHEGKQIGTNPLNVGHIARLHQTEITRSGFLLDEKKGKVVNQPNNDFKPLTTLIGEIAIPV